VQRVLPMYIAVDTSSSMAGSWLEAVQQAIVEFTVELLSDPLLGETVRVGLIAFNDDAEVVLPLSDLTELRRLPRLHSRGRTQFGPVFRLLARVVERDHRVLLAGDTSTYAPFVFFITDGMPTDRGWERSYAEFRDRTRAQLVLVAIGLDAAGDALRELRPLQVLQWRDAHEMGFAEWLLRTLEEYAQSLTRSVMMQDRDDGPLRMPPDHPPLGEQDIR
jgi:uncharacterized protein YegL